MIYLILSPFALWYLFAVVMALIQARDRLGGTFPWPIKVMGYPVLVAGLIVEIIVNWVLCTILFLELPKELTVSKRLWTYSQRDPSWRQRTATWLRVNLLDPMDPSGTHTG